MSQTKFFSEAELIEKSKEELIQIIMSLQTRLSKVPQLEQSLSDLRQQVAEQALSEEIEQEKDMNLVRILEEQCVKKGINVDVSQQRAGQGVDRVGSLQNVIGRQDAAVLNLTSYSTESSSTNELKLGLKPTIQQLSQSLQTQQLTNPKPKAAVAPPMGSYTSSNISSGGTKSAPVSILTQMSGQKPTIPVAPKQQEIKLMAVVDEVESSESAEVVV